MEDKLELLQNEVTVLKEQLPKVVSSVEEIRNKAIKLVDISGFEEGEFITLRLRSLSLMGLIRNGRIPNQLLGTAVELFEGKKTSQEPEDRKIGELSGMIDTVCENAMVEPTYAEIGEFLKDEQKMEIFKFSQGGLRELDSFRKVQANKQLDLHISNI